MGSGAASEWDAYDVAVLTLATPLNLPVAPGPDDLQRIPLGPAPGAGPGASLQLTGFGAEMPVAASADAVADGSLNSVTLTAPGAGLCVPSVDALVGCGSSPSGAVCFGDSGSALTSTATPPVVLGVADRVYQDDSGNFCEPGSQTTYTKVGAPEIADFIDGLPGPYPAAPQGGEDIDCHSFDQVGQAMTCTPGSWTNAPSFTYEFVDDTTGAVLQSGQSSSYTFTAADVGRTVYFLVIAANAGGTAYDRTVDTTAIQPAPVVSTQVTTTATSTSAPPAPAPPVNVPAAPHPKPQPTLRIYAGAGRVGPGAHLTFRVVLASGGSTVTRARVCAAAPAGTAVTPAPRGRPTGRVCWSVSLGPGSSHVYTFTVVVGRHDPRGSLTATATMTARGGLGALAASVHVLLT